MSSPPRERLIAFADAAGETAEGSADGSTARVSEPALPLLLAALHLRLERALVCLLPEDADARDAAEAAAWYLGEERVALLRAGASAGGRAWSRLRISSASGRGRSTSSPRAGSSAPPPWRSPS